MKMRKVNLRMNEQYKYEKIKYLVDHKGNKSRIALELGITTRQVNRLIKKYKEKGKSSFIHNNRSKKPANTIDKSLSESIILLYTTKYQGFNYNHFKDMLMTIENITVSYFFIYTTLMKLGLTSPRIRKSTKKKVIREQIKSLSPSTTDLDIDDLVNHQIDLEDSHPRKERSKYFGEEIQIDASNHLWFGSSKSHLHLAIDNATGIIVGGYFDKQETLFGYYNVYKQILVNYGIPYLFKTDNRTVFNYQSLNKNSRTSDKDVLTQFGYACKTFGTDIITTSVSQAKGRIERANGTFQGRLINELRIAGINDINSANNYLINYFIPNFNNRFALNSKLFVSVFESSPDNNKINYTLAVLTPRIIDNGNSIKYKNNYYQPYINDNLICFKPKTMCLVIKALDGHLLVSIDNQILELKKLESNTKLSPAFHEFVLSSSEKKKFIPPMSHPWKLASFQKQFKNAHTNHVYA